jgi:chromosome segregation ATPase
MTNEELFTDLKQFIEATVSQAEQRLEVRMATKDDISDLRTELKADIKVVDEKLDTIQDAIADSFTHATDLTNESINGVENTLEDHEQRLHRLEHRAA